MISTSFIFFIYMECNTLNNIFKVLSAPRCIGQIGRCHATKNSKNSHVKQQIKIYSKFLILCNVQVLCISYIIILVAKLLYNMAYPISSLFVYHLTTKYYDSKYFVSFNICYFQLYFQLQLMNIFLREYVLIVKSDSEFCKFKIVAY